MIPALPFWALIGVTAFLCLLPFIPALLEWRRGSDAAPLPIVRSHDGDVRHFAHSFRAYLFSQFPELTSWTGGEAIPLSNAATVRSAGLPTGDADQQIGAASDFASSIEAPAAGVLPDGTPCRFIDGRAGTGDCALRNGDAAAPTGDADAAFGPPIRNPQSAIRNPETPGITVTRGPTSLPDGATLPMELYASGPLYGGERSVYRAVLGEKEIVLGRQSVVLRWLHGEESVHVGRETDLFGRTSAEHELSLAEGCRFQRLHAPRIVFGATPQRDDTPWEAVPPEPSTINHQPSTILPPDGRWLVRGSLDVPPGDALRCDIIVNGRLRIGAGARIAGSVKSHTDLQIDPGACVDGSLVSARDLRLGAGCRVRGPVIAEREVVIEADAQIGTPEHPTTITAPRIRVAPGAVAHGTVWAREMGEVEGV